jgi:hypothetical protein
VDLEELLSAVELVDAYLDSHRSPEYIDQPLANDWARVTKVCEEAGEVWAALSRRTGENYRKGVCGTEEELLGELADCVSAAMLGIQHRTKDIWRTWAVVSAAFAKAAQRVAEHGEPATGMGYLSFPAEVRSALEAPLVPSGTSADPTPDCGGPRHPPGPGELWYCTNCEEFHEPKKGDPHA